MDYRKSDFYIVYFTTFKLFIMALKPPSIEWIPVTKRLPQLGNKVLAFEEGEIFVCNYWRIQWTETSKPEISFVVKDSTFPSPCEPSYWALIE